MRRPLAAIETPRRRSLLARRLLVVIATGVLLLAASAGIAQAQATGDAASLADVVAADGFYTEAGSGAAGGEVADLVEQLAADGITDIGFVGLTSVPTAAPNDWAVDFAEEITRELDGRRGIDTIVVVTPDDIGAFSLSRSSAVVSAAADRAAGSPSTLGAFEQFARAATEPAIPATPPTTRAAGTPTQTTEATGSDSGGGGGGVLLVLVLVVVGGVGTWLFLRSRRRKAELSSELAQDKAEIQAQLATSADLVLGLADRITLTDPATQTMFAEASRTFQYVSGALPSAITAQQIDELDDQIDVAEWQLQTVDARLDGRPGPEDPRLADRREEEARRRDQDRAYLERQRAEQDGRENRAADQKRREQEQRRAELEQRRRQPSGGRTRDGGGVLGGALGGALGGILTGGLGGSRGKAPIGPGDRQSAGATPTGRAGRDSPRSTGSFDREGFSRRTTRRRATSADNRATGGRGGARRTAGGAGRPDGGGRGGARRRRH